MKERKGETKEKRKRRSNYRQTKKKAEKAGIGGAVSARQPFEGRLRACPYHHYYARHFVPLRRSTTPSRSPCTRRTRWRRSRGSGGKGARKSRLSRGHSRHRRRQSLPAFLALRYKAPASHQQKSFTSQHGTRPLGRNPSLRVRSRCSPHSRTQLLAGAAHIREVRSSRPTTHVLLTCKLSKRTRRTATVQERRDWEDCRAGRRLIKRT